MTAPTAYFEVQRPRVSCRVAPLLVHIPHSSTNLPSEYRRAFALDANALAREILLMTDHLTDELGAGAAGFGATVFVNALSRLVMDPERFADDADEPMAARGMGAIYRLCQDGSALRPPDFSQEARNTLIELLYHPYHRALESVVAEQVEQFDCCVIVDFHSFPKLRLPYESEAPRPSVCIGFDEFHDDGVLRARWSERIAAAGLDLMFNTPFAGSLVPSRFYRRDGRVRSLMIELRRDLYMNEETGQKSASFAQTRVLVDSLLALAAERSRELLRNAMGTP